MCHYFAYRALHKWKLHTSLCTYTVKKTSFLSHKHWNIHLKHNITQMHKKHIAFPFWPVFLVAPEWHHGKASSWSERLFPSFPLWLLVKLSASPRGERLRFFKRLHGGGGGGNFSLTARQSMVKVDVAQVFWRPFWQTHFVVVVDHPPTGRQNICGKFLMQCEMLSKCLFFQNRLLWGQRKWVNLFFPFSLK